jgi:zinc transporter ZupT
MLSLRDWRWEFRLGFLQGFDTNVAFQEDPPKIWAIFISLLVHKLIVAFSVGLQLARTHAHSLRWVVISMVLISLMTPIGGFLGMLVQSAPIDAKLRDIIVLVCQGLAVGT